MIKRIKKEELPFSIAEVIAIRSMIIIAVVGVVAEIVFHGILCTDSSEDLNGFSQTILQIQSSISTLSVALIALIVGNINDTYMGISYTNYYLNIKPKYFTQKRIMLFSLLLIVIGVLFHLDRCYYLVISSFLISLFPIIISILALYSAFDGVSKINKEIYKYYNEVMYSLDTPFEIKAKMLMDFINEWCTKKELSRPELLKYKEHFQKGYSQILTTSDKISGQPLEILQELGEQILSFLLSSDNINELKCGIELTDLIFEDIQNLIIKDECRFDMKQDFSLFSSISDKLCNAIFEVPIEILQSTIKIEYFIYNVRSIQFEIGSEKNREIELSELKFFVLKLGYYLKKRITFGETYKKRYWGSLFSYIQNDYTPKILSDKIDEYNSFNIELSFSYFYTLLLNGHTDVLKTYFFNNHLESLRKYNYNTVFVVLAAHSYLFYVAECAYVDAVDEQIRKRAKELLYDNEVRYAINLFHNKLIRILYDNNFLNIEFYKKMDIFMRRYELLKKDRNIQTVLISRTVRDYFLYFCAYLDKYNNKKPILSEILRDNEFIMYAGNLDDTVKKRFYNLIISTHSEIDAQNDEKKINCDLRKISSDINGTFRKVLKRKFFGIAIADSKKYKNIDTDELSCKVEQKLVKKLSEELSCIVSDITSKPVVSSTTSDIYLYALEMNTNNVDENMLDSVFEEICGNLIISLANDLRNNTGIKIIDKSDTKYDDKEYLEYIATNNIKLMLGDESVYKPKRYKYYNEYVELTEDCEQIATDYMGSALILKENSLKFSIDILTISIDSLSENEILAKAEYDSENDRYKYELFGDYSVLFDKEELLNYVNMYRKKVTVGAKITIQTFDKEVGAIVERYDEF